ncbi:hypothetical protein NliqN6_5903 [Naganishia liquefaciens]|uniref:2-dehydropantoate 2-reductase n=1 Tax=Naganishia liquefaciens TaxID=104408 RepID=A0A8H3YJG3_9TREE|nr:hypothetical protein NliqN6_5903 [Naganishia liquefaciens]
MTTTRPNVLLFGVGSIGSVYAAILILSKRCSVHVVARSNYDALQKQGLTLRSSKFGDHEGLRFDGVYRTCEEAANSGTRFDYVVCSNKALLDAKPSLSDILQPVVTDGTAIVLLQNGVGVEEPLHEAFPNNTVLSACVWTGAKVLGPGEAEQFNREGLTIGVDHAEALSAEQEQKQLDVFVEMSRAGGSDVTVCDDIQSERWVKVIWNACWNAVTTATQLRTNRFLEASPQAMMLSRAIMGEVVDVARAKGLTVPDGSVDKLIEQCTSVKDGLPSSMLDDYVAGRPTEVEVILGTPLREGLRLGVPVPSLIAMYSIIKALDWKNAHPEEAKI